MNLLISRGKDQHPKIMIYRQTNTKIDAQIKMLSLLMSKGRIIYPLKLFFIHYF